ncbi:MAG: S4 domain-containing protein [candidate division NC10 bacterium]
MRLDLFLKTSRLVKRRGQAKALCDAGRVRVDGLPAKAARQVRAGSRIALDLSRRQVVIEVQEIQGAVGGRGRPAARYTVVVERRFTQGMAREGEEESDAGFHG